MGTIHGCAEGSQGLGGIPWKVKFKMDFCILADCGGLAELGPFVVASCWPSPSSRRALAKVGPRNQDFKFSYSPSAVEPHSDSVHGGGVGLERYRADV